MRDDPIEWGFGVLMVLVGVALVISIPLVAWEAHDLGVKDGKKESQEWSACIGKGRSPAECASAIGIGRGH